MIVQKLKCNNYGDAFAIYLTKEEAECFKKLPKHIKKVKEKDFILKDKEYGKKIEDLIKEIRPNTEEQLKSLGDEHKDHIYSTVLLPYDMPPLLIIAMDLILQAPLIKTTVQLQKKSIRLQEEIIKRNDKILETYEKALTKYENMFDKNKTKK